MPARPEFHASDARHRVRVLRPVWGGRGAFATDEVHPAVLGGVARPSLPRPGCGNNSIDARGVEDLVVDAMLMIVDTPDFAAGWTQVDESGDELDLRSKLDGVEARRNEAADTFAAGRVPLSVFERAIATIERETPACNLW